jgi:hypothetical protein
VAISAIIPFFRSGIKLTVFPMDSKEFIHLRKKFGKTQKQMAQLLGISIKAIHSYEQAWRTIPAAVERQMYFLVSLMDGNRQHRKPCWVVKKCSPDQKKRCPAWEFKSGDLCWFINGTVCEGTVQGSWKEKMKICKSCEVFSKLLSDDTTK